MHSPNVLFAMRTAIGVILGIVAVGFVIAGVVRVIIDAVTWYREQMMDPYRDLRKEARKARSARKTPSGDVDDVDVVSGDLPDDDKGEARMPAGFE